MQLHERFKDQGLQVVTVTKQPKEKLQDFAQKAPFPMLLDPDGSTFTQYNVAGTPSNYLFNSNGQVVSQTTGFNAEAFEQKIVEPVSQLVKG